MGQHSSYQRQKELRINEYRNLDGGPVMRDQINEEISLDQTYDGVSKMIKQNN